jgi:hypothetical protein
MIYRPDSSRFRHLHFVSHKCTTIRTIDLNGMERTMQVLNRDSDFLQCTGVVLRDTTAWNALGLWMEGENSWRLAFWRDSRGLG